jgi:hypothetical protein
MNRVPAQRLSLILLVAALIGVVCVSDFFIPLGVAVGVLYIVPVLATLWVAGRGITMGAASSATFLIILKFVIAPQSGIPWMVLSNRAISVFVVWATALLVLQRKHNEQTLSEQKDALQRAHDELEVRVDDAIKKLKILRGFLPICANCKNIRDEKGYWHAVEDYVASRSEASFSHGICPVCFKQLYPEYPEPNP